jgi:hypothetical protein
MPDSFSSFLLWSLMGCVIFLTSLPGFLNIRPNEKSGYWRPRGHNATQKVLWRAKLALSPYNWLHAWSLLTPAVTFGALLCWATYSDSFPLLDRDFLTDVLGISAGYCVAFGVSYYFGLGKRLRKFRLAIAEIGVKMITRLGNPQDVLPLLTATAHQTQPILRMAAASGFKELGTLDHLPILEKLAKDPVAEVVTAALATIISLQKLLVSPPLGLDQMNALIADHKNLDGLRKRRSEVASRTDYEGLYEKTTKRIDDIVYSQVKLRRDYPRLYCRQCYALAEQQSYLEWEWVRCVQCKEAMYLVGDIAHVTGQIGGSVDWELVSGMLHVRLWDVRTQKARNATMTTLDIIGGAQFDYDWAVSAVVEKLHNENPDYGKGICVKLVDAPILSRNTQQLLRDLDPQFQMAP